MSKSSKYQVAPAPTRTAKNIPRTFEVVPSMVIGLEVMRFKFDVDLILVRSGQSGTHALVKSGIMRGHFYPFLRVYNFEEV